MIVLFEDDLNERRALHVGEVADRLADAVDVAFAALVLRSVASQNRGRGGVVFVAVHAEPDSTGACVGWIAS